MKIGCFALIEPFTPMDRQFQAIRAMGFDYADLTDNRDGAQLGSEFGFAASVSLDSHPHRIAEMLGDTGLTLTAVCAHANLLDPIAPDIYSTFQIIKAIQMAHHLGIDQVITTEGDPKTAFGHQLTADQRRFAIRERLHEPIRWARSLDIQLLLEPHGIVTDNIEQTQRLLDELNAQDVVGLNLDTGNLWLGGGDNLKYIETFGPMIRHVHWKDMPADMEAQRGKMFGCGMAVIPLGDGVIGIESVVKALKSAGFDGPTTLEIAGEDAVKRSAERLRQWWQ